MMEIKSHHTLASQRVPQQNQSARPSVSVYLSAMQITLAHIADIAKANLTSQKHLLK